MRTVGVLSAGGAVATLLTAMQGRLARQQRYARTWSLLALASLAVTAGIGGVAVLNGMHIHPVWSAIDQGTAMLSFGLLVAIAVRARAQERTAPAMPA